MLRVSIKKTEVHRPDIAGHLLGGMTLTLAAAAYERPHLGWWKLWASSLPSFMGFLHSVCRRSI